MENKVGSGEGRAGVLDVVLRGGRPWGLTLVGGDEYNCPLTIAEVRHTHTHTHIRGGHRQRPKQPGHFQLLCTA